MEDLEAGVGANPNILISLDQHIRQTPLYDVMDLETPNFDEPLPPESIDLVPELMAEPSLAAAADLDIELDALDLALAEGVELPVPSSENPMLAMMSETVDFELDQLLNGMSQDFSLELEQEPASEEEDALFFDAPTVLESADDLLTELDSPADALALMGDRPDSAMDSEEWMGLLDDPLADPPAPSAEPDWQLLLSEEEEHSLNAFADQPADPLGEQAEDDLLMIFGVAEPPTAAADRADDDFLAALTAESPDLPTLADVEDPFAFLFTATPEPLGPVDLLLNEFADRGESALPPEPKPPILLPERFSRDDHWILGIDFGTTAMRVSVGNAANGRHYVLNFDRATDLPTEVRVPGPDADPTADPTEDSLPRDGTVERFKPLLKVGLSYRGIHGWQPVIGRSHARLLLAGLRNLLRTIPERACHPMLPDLATILQNLRCVVLAHPTHWSDTYGFNVREAVLRAELVSQPDQVLVVEEAIAPFLTQYHRQAMVPQVSLHLNGGATTTHLTLARILDDHPKRHDLFDRGLDFGGDGMTQDLVTQLLYPQWQALPHEPPLSQRQLPRIPEPADPAPRDRILWQQFLHQDETGRALLAAAEAAKHFFSQASAAEEWQHELLGVPLSLTRREFESRIVQPYIQRLNREVNLLLSLAGITGSDLTQVFFLGGTFQIASLHRWLGQKFPNAQIESLAATTLAEGLAIAPLYPQLLDLTRHQYSDYFLLYEICRLNLKEPFTPTYLLQLLHRRGVNIHHCRDRLLNLLQGELPAGIFPWQEPEGVVVAGDPGIQRDVLAAPLFELETDGCYRPNLPKFQHLRAYLQNILDSSRQSLNEPLVFPTATPAPTRRT
jgi:hypothetical protein